MIIEAQPQPIASSKCSLHSLQIPNVQIQQYSLQSTAFKVQPIQPSNHSLYSLQSTAYTVYKYPMYKYNNSVFKLQLCSLQSTKRSSTSTSTHSNRTFESMAATNYSPGLLCTPFDPTMSLRCYNYSCDYSRRAIGYFVFWFLPCLRLYVHSCLFFL